MDVLAQVIAIIVGCVVGFISALIFNRILSRAYGTLRIDRTDPTKEVYRIELGDLDKLARKKRIVLKIDNNADLSQK